MGARATGSERAGATKQPSFGKEEVLLRKRLYGPFLVSPSRALAPLPPALPPARPPSKEAGPALARVQSLPCAGSGGGSSRCLRPRCLHFCELA